MMAAEKAAAIGAQEDAQGMFCLNERENKRIMLSGKHASLVHPDGHQVP